MSSRPRLSNETSELIDRVDTLANKYEMDRFDNIELEPLKGRGNGTNNFTKDSVIRFALKRTFSDLDDLDAVLEEMSGNE